MKNNNLLVFVGLCAFGLFLFLKQKTLTKAANSPIPVPSDSSIPKQNTVIQFPLAPIVQEAIIDTAPDVYRAPDLPPPIGVGDTVTTYY